MLVDFGAQEAWLNSCVAQLYRWKVCISLTSVCIDHFQLKSCSRSEIPPSALSAGGAACSVKRPVSIDLAV